MKTPNKIIMLNYPPALDFSYADKGGIYPSTAIMLLGTLLKDNGYDVNIIVCAYEGDYLDLLVNNVDDSELI